MPQKLSVTLIYYIEKRKPKHVFTKKYSWTFNSLGEPLIEFFGSDGFQKIQWCNVLAILENVTVIALQDER